MKLDGADKEKLRELFERQLQGCEKVPKSFSPAKHRSTQIDTNKTLRGTSDSHAALLSAPAGPYSTNPGARLTVQSCRSKGFDTLQDSSSSSKKKGKGTSSSSKLAAAVAGQLPAVLAEEHLSTSIYKSDYSPGPEQHHVAQLMATRRGLQAGSEWALLNKLEHTIVVQQDAAHLAALLREQEQQRRLLDAQVAEREVARKAAQVAKAADLAAAVSDITAFQAEEAAKAKAAAAVADRLKQDRQRQMAAAQAARKRAADKKAREEQALLAAINQQMAEAKAAAAAKAADAKSAMQAARIANDAALAAKKAAAHQQQQEDEELMQETIRTLQKQEEAREAALKAFHDDVATRAVQAGAAAVAVNKSRQEREDRLVAASEARAQAEAEAKCAAEVTKRAAMVADLKACAAAAAAAKAATRQAAQEERERVRADIEADLHQFQHEERFTEQQRRKKNLDYRRALEQQIAEAEARAVLNDVFMDERERDLNMQLVAHTAAGLASMHMN